jgi:hypothetical protein
MKKKILVLTAVAMICLTTTLMAQNWTVGVPVNFEIIDLPGDIEVTAYCDSMNGQEAEFRIPLPIVTGVSYYVHVDNAIPSTDSFKLIHNGITQILGLGDSMLIVPVATTPCIQFGQPCEVVKLSYNGPVPQLIASFASLKFMAVGTPTVVGENYPYSPCDSWFNQGIGCLFPHYVAEIDIITGDTCFTTLNTVKSTVSINEHTQTLFSIFPNPAQNDINIKADARLIGSKFIIYDNTGRTVLNGKINSENTRIELGNLSGGVYLFSVGETMKQTFKVIKN